MPGLSRKRKQSKTPVTNRGHSYTSSVADLNYENGDPKNEDNGTLVTPPPKKRVMKDKTNTADINSPISDIFYGNGQ